jgi:intracellular sulfur oxidation DsrE/DsrF family protein
MDDALWAKYPVARVANVKPSEANRKKDPFPAFNPYARPHTEAEKEYGEYLLEGLLGAGAVVLACNNAFMGFTYRLAKETKADLDAVRAEARAGLLRGVALQPSGVYATLRAQEVGCTFMRS